MSYTTRNIPSALCALAAAAGMASVPVASYVRIHPRGLKWLRHPSRGGNTKAMRIKPRNRRGRSR